MKNKIKVLVLSDNPLAPSGVGTQTRYMLEPLLKTQEFRFVCLAGAIQHRDYKPIKVEPYGDDLIIHPVDGYGNPQIVRSILHTYKPDIVWFMTDPRFWVWLWDMAPEIRKNVPMVYYHVWDNYPYPTFNKSFYDSNDLICTISKVTHDIVTTVSPTVEAIRIPHTVDTNVFRPHSLPNMKELARKGSGLEDKFVFFWNNRNARRKMSGSLIYWFKDFLDIVGHDKASLIMHTEPNDPHGQDLYAIISELGLNSGQIKLSVEKLPPEGLANIYLSSDCTINISDAEGFGLSTLESLACGVPIVVNMTGGLQEQVTDGSNWFGVGIEPSSKAIIGSQEVPYIYEDRISKEDFIAALLEMYNMSEEDREQMGLKGRKHVLDNYGFSAYAGHWYQTLIDLHEKHGSWENRKNYKNWELIKL
tara:strand:- start:526 stop:1779 length:1254 start_codon:yes stop_codon:yes gene_type:complete